jgi:glycosyltransferase involved in cell wall biosynthesis
MDSTVEMPPPRTRVLFISHDFAHAGAQLFLLRLVQWMKRNSELAFDVLINVPRANTAHAQPLEATLLADFGATAEVFFLDDTGQPENLAKVQAGDYGVIYANTATLGPLLAGMRPFPARVISHIHELRFWIERRMGKDRFALLDQQADHFIACSTVVRDNLVTNLGVDPGKVTTIHEFTSVIRFSAADREQIRSEVRSELKIPQSAFLLLSCGTFDWRKGAELFTPFAAALRKHAPDLDFHAIWVGHYGSDLYRDQLEHEMDVLGLAGRVRLLGPSKEPEKYMYAADAFLLPSKEDPFPIVMLEAAAAGLPVLAFDGSGGAAEFIGTDAGLLCPYLDVSALAANAATLARTPQLRKYLGATAAHKVTTLYDERVQCPKILHLIETVQNA